MGKENDDIPVLHFTEKAVKKIAEVRKSQEVPDIYRLRVGIRGGGCGAMGYVLGFDEMQETDHAYEIQGMDVVIDKRHAMYVLGMEVDYIERDDQQGFVFNNPEKRKEV